MQFMLLLFSAGVFVAAAQPVINTVAGTNWIYPDGRRAIEAPLGRVNSVATDSAGNVYFADATANMVMKLTRRGAVLIVAGNGFQAYSGDGDRAVNASVSFPLGVAVHTDGTVYITDSHNFRIRKVSPNGIITTIAGRDENRTSGDNGPAERASLGEPKLAALDKNQNFYFVDTDSNAVQRIRRISAEGIITTVAGGSNCTVAANRTYRDNIPANQYCFFGIPAIAVDSAGTLFIADSVAHIVVKVVNNTLLRVAGGGSSTTATAALEAQISGPEALAVDSQGAVYFFDRAPRLWRVANGTIAALAGSDYGFQEGTGTSAQFRGPFGLAVDSSLNVLVADSENFRIRSVSSGGAVSTIAGSGKIYDNQGDSLARLSPLSLPYGVGLDPSQTLHIADSFNFLVRAVRQNNILTIAGTGSAGSSTSNNVPATSVDLGSPMNVVFDSAGNAYFPDFHTHVVRRVSPNGTMTIVAGIAGRSGVGAENVQATATPLNFPIFVARDSANNLYISDFSNFRVRRVAPDGTIHTFAGNGRYELNGDNGPATQAGIGQPLGIAVDSTGAVFVASRFETTGRIRRIANGAITTVAGGGGQSAFNTPVQATLARLGAPAGLAVDGNNNIFFADTILHAVFQLTGGTLRPVAGTSRRAFAGDGGIATNASLNTPFGVAVDRANNIYIADTFNNRVRAVTTVPPAFAVDRTQITFRTTQDGPQPADESIALRASATGLPYSARSDQRWLHVTPSTGVVPIQVTVTADPAGLAPGTYNANVTLVAPGGQPASVRVPVTFTIERVIQPKPEMVVDATSRIFQFKTGDAGQSATVSIANKGNAPFQYTTTVEMDNGAWLKLDPVGAAETVPPGTTTSLTYTVDPRDLEPDTYAGKLTITPSAGLAAVTIPVVITVADGAPRILLSQSAVNFTAVQGGGAPLSQSFAVLNEGAGTLSYDVEWETLKGGPDWMDVLGDPDDVDPGQLFLSTVGVSVDPTDLEPGLYTGRVRISDPNALNSPQTVTVYLTVLSPNENPGPDMAPGGVVFQANPGARPGSRTVLIANRQKSILTYRVVNDVPSGQNWLAAAPDNGAVVPKNCQANNSAPGCPAEAAAALDVPIQSGLKIQPDFTGLQPGSYRAKLVVTFSDNTSRTVDVLGVVNEPFSDERGNARPADGCTPAVSISDPTDNSTVTRTAGLAITLKATLTTKCGVNDRVLFQVNNQQPGTYMEPRGNDFVFTYLVKPTDTQLQFKFTALSVQLVGGNLGGVGNLITRMVNVTEPVIKSTPPPVPKFVNNAATGESRALIAPGLRVTITGDDLADGAMTTDPQAPSTDLGGTSVEVAGVKVPLLSVAPDKITAIVPYRLKRDTKQEIRVRRGDQESVSLNLVVARTQPGILTVDGAPSGQGRIYRVVNGNLELADAASPASAGERVIILVSGLGDVASSTLPAGTLPTIDDDVTVRSGVQVTIGGRQAQVLRQELSTVAVGQYEVEVEVPEGITPGAAAVRLIAARQPSPGNITMAVK
ncbi:MAG: hypothetical protein HY820_45820 [Acidobacteria bacterium]|nr:hypothetical protein [Acidobacteriota bacterium]